MPPPPIPRTVDPKFHIYLNLTVSVLIFVIVFFFDILPSLSPYFSYSRGLCRIKKSSISIEYCCKIDCGMDACGPTATYYTYKRNDTLITSCSAVRTQLDNDIYDPVQCSKSSDKCAPNSLICYDNTSGFETTCCKGCVNFDGALSNSISAANCQCNTYPNRICQVSCPVCYSHVLDLETDIDGLSSLRKTKQYNNSDIVVLLSQFYSRLVNTENVCYYSKSRVNETLFFGFDTYKFEDLGGKKLLLLFIPIAVLFSYLSYYCEQYAMDYFAPNYALGRDLNAAAIYGILIPFVVFLPIVIFGIVDDAMRRFLVFMLVVSFGLGWSQIFIYGIRRAFTKYFYISRSLTNRVLSPMVSLLIYCAFAVPICGGIAYGLTIPVSKSLENSLVTVTYLFIPVGFAAIGLCIWQVKSGYATRRQGQRVGAANGGGGNGDAGERDSGRDDADAQTICIPDQPECGINMSPDGERLDRNNDRDRRSRRERSRSRRRNDDRSIQRTAEIVAEQSQGVIATPRESEVSESGSNARNEIEMSPTSPTPLLPRA